MIVITENPHAWFKVVNDAGNELEVENNETPEHNYPFAFEANFSDTASPPVNTVTLYNMSKGHRNFYQKKQKCYLYFNWGDEKKLISEGYISKIASNQSDGVTESLTLTFTEGTDYKNVEARKLKVKKDKRVNHYKTIKQMVPGKYVNKRVHYYTTENGKRVGHYKTERVYQKATVKKKRIKTRVTKTFLTNKTFKKGKSYKFIIKAIAKQAGIKISKIELAKNPTMKKAYTAKGKPLTLLKALVKKCDSKMTYARGKLEVVDPKKKKRSWVVIDDDSLMNPPTMNDDSDGKSNTWEITTPLLPDVTVNVGIKMESKYLKGKFYVAAGQHSSDGTRPQTQMSLKKVS